MTSTEVPARFADAPRAKSHGGFIHTCNPDGANPLAGLPFGKKNPEGCARCWEMVNGAPARADFADHGGKARREAQDRAAMRAHFADPDHRTKCGPVCTAFDW